MKNAPFLSADQPSPSAAGEDRLFTWIRWALNIAILLLVVWLMRDWLIKASELWREFFEKGLPRYLGIPAGIFGALISVLEVLRYTRSWKKKQQEQHAHGLSGKSESDLPDQPGEIVPR
jgi:hypothetical protein